MTLTIISHTEHYTTSEGTIVGWGPTISEINQLLNVFDHIYHVAMLHEGVPPSSSMPYQSDKITFVPLPVLGGHGIAAKLKIIIKSFEVIHIVNATLKSSDCFQLRTPTGIGVFMIPYLTFFVRKKGWYKYAGNWNQKQPPLGYRLQRWMLKKQSRTVTINGKWPEQPTHCLTFENPCLTLSDLDEGIRTLTEKSVEGDITVCYVGRLEKQKGVEHIISSFGMLLPKEKQRIKAVHLVGNGEDIERFKEMSSTTGVHFVFHGFLSREEVFKIYKKAQVFLMPTTASEGFPKVIAEAMNFGCIPVVSTVSSIGQYVKEMETGICIETVNNEAVLLAIRKILQLHDPTYQRILGSQRDIVKSFTFDYYNNRIANEIMH